MDMTGERRIPAPRQTVWEALNDTEVLRVSIPGCESLERLEGDQMKATAAVKIGPISARFTAPSILAIFAALAAVEVCRRSPCRRRAGLCAGGLAACGGACSWPGWCRRPAAPGGCAYQQNGYASKRQPQSACDHSFSVLR